MRKPSPYTSLCPGEEGVAGSRKQGAGTPALARPDAGSILGEKGRDRAGAASSRLHPPSTPPPHQQAWPWPKRSQGVAPHLVCAYLVAKVRRQPLLPPVSVAALLRLQPQQRHQLAQPLLHLRGKVAVRRKPCHAPAGGAGVEGERGQEGLAVPGGHMASPTSWALPAAQTHTNRSSQVCVRALVRQDAPGQQARQAKQHLRHGQGRGWQGRFVNLSVCHTRWT